MTRSHYADMGNGTQARRIDLSKLAEGGDLAGISSVCYAHDPLPSCASSIQQPVLSLPAHRASLKTSATSPGRRLWPLNAGLPFRCSLASAHETTFWRQGIDASIHLLQLTAEDVNAADVEVDNGVTLAKLARHELRPGIEHRFSKATLYMYPFAIDAQRVELLAGMMVLQFVFDDKAEETSDDTVSQTQQPVLLSSFLIHNPVQSIL